MRAAEQIPFGGRRPKRHDEMCAIVGRAKHLIFPRFNGETNITVEAPIGGGFADLLATTDAPPTDVEAAIVEVKTRQENASAGDTIRQLRWYQQRLPVALKRHPVRLIAVVEDVGAVTSEELDLFGLAGVEVLPIGYFETASGYRADRSEREKDQSEQETDR